MVCSRCGTPGSGRFCGVCGGSMVEAPAQQSPAQQYGPPSGAMPDVEQTVIARPQPSNPAAPPQSGAPTPPPAWAPPSTQQFQPPSGRPDAPGAWSSTTGGFAPAPPPPLSAGYGAPGQPLPPTAQYAAAPSASGQFPAAGQLPPVEPAGRGRMFAIIGVAAVLLAGGGAAWWFLSGSSSTAAGVGAVTVQSYPTEPVSGAEIHADELVSGATGLSVVGSSGDQLVVMALGYDVDDSEEVGVVASVSAIDGTEKWSTDLTEMFEGLEGEGAPRCSVAAAEVACIGWSGNDPMIARFNLDSGELTSEVELPGASWRGGVVGDKTQLLLNTSKGKRSELTAFDTTTGAEQWTVDPGEWSDDDVVDLTIQAFGDKWLVHWATSDGSDYETQTSLLNGETGEVIVAFDQQVFSASPAQTMLYQFSSSDDPYRGFSRVDEQGNKLWSARGVAYPFNGDGTLLAITKDGEIVSLNPETGETLWESKKSFDGSQANRIVGDRIYVGHGGTGGVLRLETGEAISGIAGKYVAQDGTAVFTVDEEELIATSLSDNTKIWRSDLSDLDRDLDEGQSATVIVEGDRLIINSYGRLVVLNPA